MRKIVFLSLFLAACSSGRVDQTLMLDKEVQPMSRNEVITAINECESSGTRAVMVYAKRRINNYLSDVVVDVTCAPKPRLPF